MTNAGGLNPAGLAAALRELAERARPARRIAHVEGDDLRRAPTELGHRHAGVGQRLPRRVGHRGGARGGRRRRGDRAGHRRRRSSSVRPPAHFGWARDDWDALAGAVVAGHVIECGPQATGGNYAFFDEITDLRQPGLPDRRDRRRRLVR